MICKICPHVCDIAPGDVGRCKVRINDGNKIRVGPWYGHCSAIAVDAIEKRPFFHLTPGEKYLSVGFMGCSFFCSGCVNFKVAYDFDHTRTPLNHYHSPVDLLKLAKNKKTKGIVFTYNEPTVHWEYLYELGSLLVNTNLFLALKTNGFVTEYAMRGLLPLFDATNVDIKGDEEYYQECGGSLEATRKTIQLIISQGFWLEVSYFVPPSMIDKSGWHRETAKWLASLSPSIPVHILYSYPMNKVKNSYAENKLYRIYNVLKEQLKYVYISNLFKDEFMKFRDTTCPKCGEILISRRGKTEINRLSCCGEKVAGILL